MSSLREIPSSFLGEFLLLTRSCVTLREQIFHHINSNKTGALIVADKQSRGIQLERIALFASRSLVFR